MRTWIRKGWVSSGWGEKDVEEDFTQVVIKEGELGSLAPLGGDESTIRAQQVFFSSDVVIRDAESWCRRREGGEGLRVFLTNRGQPLPLWRKMRRWQIRSILSPLTADLSKWTNEENWATVDWGNECKCEKVPKFITNSCGCRIINETKPWYLISISFLVHPSNLLMLYFLRKFLLQ